MAKFDGLEPRRCQDNKGIVACEIGSKSFGTLEKLLTEQTRRIYGLADPTGQ